MEYNAVTDISLLLEIRVGKIKSGIFDGLAMNRGPWMVGKAKLTVTRRAIPLVMILTVRGLN
jgi:hypothetical protein